MKINDYLQKSSVLFNENRLLKFCFVVMAIAFCFNSVMTQRALKYQRTIILPPNIAGAIEYKEGQPSPRYIKELSRTIANLAGTWSPSTVRESFESLLYYYSPEAYPAASVNWYSLASRAEEGLVSSSFYLEKISIEKNVISLFGKLVQFTGDTPLQNQAKTYLVTYRINNGKFEILSFKEKAARVDAHAKEEGDRDE